MQKKESPYSADKVARFPDRLVTLAQGGHIAPVHVQLVLSDLCNQDCSFCAYRMSGYTSNQLFSGPNGERNPKRMIPKEKAIEILRDCAAMGVRAIEFTGGGEPTVHPDFAELLAFAQELGLSTSLVTNGVLLRDRVPIDILMRLKWIRISLDAGLEETYTEIRGTPKNHFGKAISNLAWLCRAADETPMPPTIGAGFVVTLENWNEIEDCVLQVKSLGADNIRISGIFQSEGVKYFAGWGGAAFMLAKKCEAHSDDTFTVFNRLGEKMDDLDASNPDYKDCDYMKFTTYIGADLNVYTCCVYSYNERGKIGSISQETFHRLWNSPKTIEFMKAFDARACERCQFNDKNRTIALYKSGKIEINPNLAMTHAEFI